MSFSFQKRVECRAKCDACGQLCPEGTDGEDNGATFTAERIAVNAHGWWFASSHAPTAAHTAKICLCDSCRRAIAS
jgi:hypothetical protein